VNWQDGLACCGMETVVYLAKSGLGEHLLSSPQTPRFHASFCCNICEELCQCNTGHNQACQCQLADSIEPDFPMSRPLISMLALSPPNMLCLPQWVNIKICVPPNLLGLHS
jgi:hypothetical protein